MADPTAEGLSGGLSQILNFLAAAGGLGTAAMGLVDATKAFGGGPSNFGFGHIKKTLSPFLTPLGKTSPTVGGADILQTLKANWLNGVAKADQKAKVKSLIHLGLTKGNAPALAQAAGVDPKLLESLADKTAEGKTKVSPEEMSVLGQFDAVLSAVLDAAYERGDQKYRNASKALAMLAATVMSIVGGITVFGNSTFPYISLDNFCLSVLVGISATPLAPVAKDLASSLQAAVNAVGSLKR
jgi:hypothetical protein